MNPNMSQWPNLKPLDKRLNLYSSKVAERSLIGQVEAEEFIDGDPFHIATVLADLKSEPNHECGLDCQIVRGENVLVFAEKNGWAWVKSIRDNYVGWTKSSNLASGVFSPTHWVSVPRTYVYPQADMKSSRSGYLGMAAGVMVVGKTETRGTKYLILKDGNAMIADHLAPIDKFYSDYVEVAELLLRTPYLWGGSSSYGIDCSGLVQLSMRMAGIEVLRDSDMQAASIGTPFEANQDWSNIKRGDLVFWRGHVGICQGVKDGQQYLIHANGNTMDVTSEPLDEAIKRIEFLYEKPIGFRRPVKIGA